jgi:ribosomal 30S subunit maturation factor RimM
VLDSITFGEQISDFSFLRCPNGIGNFMISDASFESFNCIQGLNEENQATFNVYPNPNDGTFYISSNENIENLTVYNAYGQVVKVNQKGENGLFEIKLEAPSAGIYLVGINNQFKKVIIR